MNQSTPRTNRLIWVGLALTGSFLVLAYLLGALAMKPVQSKPLPVLAQVADFTLTNQEGQKLSLEDLRGHVWIADIIFTRCAGPCLTMSRAMKDLQDALAANSNLKLISLTTDPEFDTPVILKRYAERFGADRNRWNFLTGTKQQIAKLAIDSLKLTTVEKKPEERATPQDLFIHSTIFVIVDKRGQLRGVFETAGDETNPQQMKTEIISTVRRLERES